MRIGKEYKPCEVKFGDGLKIGEAFYYRGEYDNKEELYMKIRYIEYDECHCDMGDMFNGLFDFGDMDMELNEDEDADDSNEEVED